MSSESRSNSTPRSAWTDRIRRVQRFSEQHGLVLETLLAVVVLGGFAVSAVTTVVGFGAAHPGPGRAWGNFFLASWSFVLLGLAGLGIVVVCNTLLPLVRIRADGFTVDSDRFRAIPRWDLLKLCCSVFVVVFSSWLLFRVAARVLEPILPVVVDPSISASSPLIMLFPWVAFVLVTCVVLQALGRAVLRVVESI